MEITRQTLAPRAAVFRGSRRCTTDGRCLVPVDIASIKPGKSVPADLRLLNTHGLQVQESILTGESVALEKSATTVKPAAALGNRACRNSAALQAAADRIGLPVNTLRGQKLRSNVFPFDAKHRCLERRKGETAQCYQALPSFFGNSESLDRKSDHHLPVAHSSVRQYTGNTTRRDERCNKTMVK